MQALKKAERAKRSGLQEPEPDGTELEPRPPAREPYVADDSPATRIKHELSLEPIEPAVERPHDPVPPQARHEVPHPEARIEPDMRPAEDARMATPADLDAIAAASADTGRANGHAGDAAAVGGSGEGHASGRADAATEADGGRYAGRAGAGTRASRVAAGESAAARRAAASASSEFAAQGASLATKGPARARTAADIPSEHRGLDAARLRIAGLSGLLVLILGIFGYIYWKAAMAPGPGAGLPMVPMPPPSATGASGIIVVPGATPAGAGQYAGGPGIATDPAPAQGSATPAMIPGTSIATTPASASSAAPAAMAPAVPATTAPAPPVTDAASGAPATAAVQPVRERAPAARPAAPRNTVPAGPSAAQLASIEDPAMRREAMRDAAERQARAIQEVQASQPAAAPGAMPAAAGVDPGTLAATAPASAGGAAPAALAGGEVRISRSTNAAIVNPSIQSGYAAFQSGDLPTARQQYQLALGQDPTSRDALLGLAAVALREHQGQQAAATYTRLLELDAADPDALAGLVSLGAGDMQHSESRLKELLRRKPEAGPVHFALGNLYAKQARWNEAQQSFFRAYTSTPSNPDYAFNLAVGLDRLNQPRLAASYYQRALLLVQTVPASFDRTAAERRLQELGGPAAAP
ncbi:tetratricopeptide repeat protein [Massilia sp. SM-13]|uniref:tetratricopeptide repeat protein n=1 Tax=Pseudoduganella rhizocola TaxID=3382643 RepID=UPI0038B5461D